MKLRVLGLYGGYPRDGVGTSSFLLEQDGYKLLIDIGSGAINTLESIDTLDSVSSVLVSHEHGDHIADAEVAMYGRLISMQLGRAKEPLCFYGPEIRILKERLEAKGAARYNVLEEGISYRIGPFEVEPVRTKHECVTYGYKIKYSDKTLFYTSDSAFSETLAEKAYNADLLLVECSIYDEYGSGERFGHMNGSECARFLKLSRPKKALLVHLPSYGDNTKLLDSVRASYKGDVELAEYNVAYNVI